MIYNPYVGMTIKAMDGREVNVHAVENHTVYFGKYMPNGEVCGLFRGQKEWFCDAVEKAVCNGASLYSLLQDDALGIGGRVGVLWWSHRVPSETDASLTEHH